MALRPTADCRLFILDDAGVVFCEGQQELYALNTTATLVWIGLEEDKNEEKIAGSLARTFEISLDRARQEVSGLLNQWRARGLLAGSEGARLPLKRPQANDIGPLPLPPTNLSRYSQWRYRLLDTAFTVVYGEAVHEAWVHPILSHLTGDAPAPNNTELLIAKVEDGFLILRDGAAEEFCSNLAGLGPAIKAYLLRSALNDHRYLFNIHASVVERGENCLLLPAVTGRGKSILTAGLVHAGWHYLSDESAPLGADHLRVRPVPLALAIKPGAWSLLTPHYPEIEYLKVHVREDMKRVRYLSPPPGSIAPDRPEGYPVKWIVFPEYYPSAYSELQPLAKVDTMRRLLAECLSLPGRLDKLTVARLVDWITEIEGYHLPNSSLHESVQLVDSLPR